MYLRPNPDYQLPSLHSPRGANAHFALGFFGGGGFAHESDRATIQCNLQMLVEECARHPTNGLYPMTNPVLENIRRALGGTVRTPLSLRSAAYEPQLPESIDPEITRFLDEIKKLSGIGQQLSAAEIDFALKTLVVEQNIRKAAIWETPHLKQLGIREILNSLGVEPVPLDANKDDMAQCELRITEVDYRLPETGTLL